MSLEILTKTDFENVHLKVFLNNKTRPNPYSPVLKDIRVDPTHIRLFLKI